MNETNSTTTLQVRNPSIAAGLTPIFTVFVTQIINVNRDLSPVTKHWIIGIDAFIVLTLLILYVRLGTRKVDLLLRPDSLTFGKKDYTLDQVVKITYYQKSRSLRVQTRPAWRGFTVYLGKKDEAPILVNQIEQWIQQTGVSYLVK